MGGSTPAVDGTRQCVCLRALPTRETSGMGCRRRNHAHLCIRDPAVIQDLQQDVKHVHVRLLDLIEQDNAVGPPPHRVRQHAALLIPHIACGWVGSGGGGVGVGSGLRG